jgi:hypothetical protein
MPDRRDRLRRHGRVPNSRLIRNLTPFHRLARQRIPLLWYKRAQFSRQQDIA